MGVDNKPRAPRFHNAPTPGRISLLIQREAWGRIRALTLREIPFALRLPPAALPPHLARTDGILISDSPTRQPVVIGIRDFPGEQRLSIKLPRRKNARQGFTAMRPCFRGDNPLLLREKCPMRLEMEVAPRTRRTSDQ